MSHTQIPVNLLACVLKLIGALRILCARFGASFTSPTGEESLRVSREQAFGLNFDFRSPQCHSHSLHALRTIEYTLAPQINSFNQNTLCVNTFAQTNYFQTLSKSTAISIVAKCLSHHGTTARGSIWVVIKVTLVYDNNSQPHFHQLCV